MINYSNDSFVAVIIQYRLGAFGFLNSPQMASAEGLNAGITDTQVALEWVQKHIHLFGGDKDQVTMWGQSAGGGTILHLLAAQAEQGRKNLWRSAVVSSPYLTPMGACDSSFWQVRRSHHAASTPLQLGLLLIPEAESVSQLFQSCQLHRQPRLPPRRSHRSAEEPQPHLRLDFAAWTPVCL
jgi:carboxylesterase type B